MLSELPAVGYSAIKLRDFAVSWSVDRDESKRNAWVELAPFLNERVVNREGVFRERVSTYNDYAGFRCAHRTNGSWVVAQWPE